MSFAALSPIANHLWQCTLFAGIAWLLTLALRSNRARVRHGLWLAASLKFLIPFSIFVTLGSHASWRTARPVRQSAASVVVDEVSQPFAPPSASPLLQSVPAAANPLPSILLAVWACGFIGIGVSWHLRWRRVRAAVHSGSPVRLELPIQAVASPTLLEPGVFGIFRPILMLPEGIADRLSPEQLRAVIAHELCHVRHRDNLAAAAHMFVETLFWFHPLVWWIGKRMVEERERGCDEEVLAALRDPRTYAEGILNVCKLYVESPLTCVSGVSGSNLKKRIEAIMAHRMVKGLSVTRKALLGAAAVAAVTGPVIFGIANAPRLRAQMPAPLAFEVASIKPHELPGGGFIVASGGAPFRVSGSRVTLTLRSVSALIRAAYDVKDFQVVGAPAWAGDRGDYYDVEAKAPGDAAPSNEQVRLMLQSLLADRFRLKLHRDSKEMAVYHLVIGKNGSKLKPIAPDAPRAQSMPNVWRSPFEQLTGTLSRQLDRPMIDQTGLTGTFEYTMNWGQIDIARRDDPDGFVGADLSTAVQEQLGLKLESAREQVPILVIDRVEKPSVN